MRSASPTAPAETNCDRASPSRGRIFAAAALLALLVLAAYGNSFGGPFVLDDVFAIADNPTLRTLWPPGAVLHPPSAHGETVGGRPLLNLTLALNYAHGGLSVRGYHAVNLAIHVLATLTLFGLVRRTLLAPALRARFATAALPVSFSIAAVWGLHPLQTEAVTYIIQRAESLMGLFYLLTLYGVARAAESPTPMRWQVIAVVSCLSGMATKEVMVTAPLLAFLYDRTFHAGSFREAWRVRRGLHGALACTWILSVWLAQGASSRGGSAGLGAGGISSFTYALTQAYAITHYLRLAIWPAPLVFDYGPLVLRNVTPILPAIWLVLTLLMVTAVSLHRWPLAGFLGAWFFLILAPTSSVVPIATQTIAEHRMYLPLAAMVAVAVATLYFVAGRRSFVVFAATIALLGISTFHRNENYRDALTLWNDTVKKRPKNGRAQLNLGVALAGAGRLPEALGAYEQAIHLQPDQPEAHNNRANALMLLGRLSEALLEYEAALKLAPDYVDGHYNFAKSLGAAGRVTQAIDEFETAIRLQPAHVEARNALATLLARTGRIDNALQQYEESLRWNPHHAPTYNQLGNALMASNRLAQAADAYEHALKIEEDYPDAHLNLGHALFALERFREAATHYARAVELRPTDAGAHAALADALAASGRMPEAKAHYREALRLEPNYNEVRQILRELENR
jgi:Flp pilus assembly protein TadD